MREGLDRKLDAWIARHVCHWGKDCYGDMPHYSTDIAAAWEVVKKLNLLGDYELSKIYGNAGKYGVWDGDTLITEADTAPMAICLAAYKHEIGEEWEE